MGAEVPKDKVVVDISVPLDQRLKEHPLQPGQHYYFVNSKDNPSDNPDTVVLTREDRIAIEQIEAEMLSNSLESGVGKQVIGIELDLLFDEINKNFKAQLKTDLPNSNSLSILFDSINTEFNGAENKNGQIPGENS